MSLFIISDTHFSHRNIIEYCQRPFSTAEEMDRVLIENWNAVVGDNDTVLHLGDVGLCYTSMITIVQKLKGRKLLIRGNHDWNKKRMTNLGFELVTAHRDDVYHDTDGEYNIIATHRPRHLPVWDGSSKMDIRLCGHVHNNSPMFIKWMKEKGILKPIMALNMSCEYWDYKPTLIGEVIDVYQRLLEANTRKTHHDN